jgi:WS/DGAT/MGAT family acyltransferase
MSAVDTAWLRMDRPSNLMMITGVMLLDGPVDIERLRAQVGARFACFDRFRQRPVQRAGGAWWEADRNFDLDYHVVEVALPGRAGDRELQALVSRLACTPLNPARPLWQFQLVSNYRGGSALMLRIHHCYADGIALVQVTMSMLDAGPDGPPAVEPPPRKARPEGAGAASAAQPLTDAMNTALTVGATMVEKGVELWHDPARALALAEQGGAIAAEIANLALMREDSPTRFKGRPGLAKRVAWTKPIPLDEVKAVGKALGSSVNDVLLSCAAGALREYLVAKGDAVDGVVLRAIVPVNLRSLEDAFDLGNEFGLIFLDLPVGIENPFERLYAVRAGMRALKGSYQPIIALGLLAAMGAGPLALQDQLLGMLARNATAVMTNVPGPERPLHVAGAKITGQMFWVPQSGDIGMGVSILSYAGGVQFGLITDRGLCPDPEHVIARFAPEFEKLVLGTLLSPWPRKGDLDPALAAQVIGRCRSARQSSSERASSTSSRSIASAGLQAAASR